VFENVSSRDQFLTKSHSIDAHIKKETL